LEITELSQLVQRHVLNVFPSHFPGKTDGSFKIFSGIAVFLQLYFRNGNIEVGRVGTCILASILVSFNGFPEEMYGFGMTVYPLLDQPLAYQSFRHPDDVA